MVKKLEDIWRFEGKSLSRKQLEDNLKANSGKSAEMLDNNGHNKGDTQAKLIIFI